ncbi:guanylin-like [Aquarana catesbeiana]|uniref:guanylin-like n=1 Tax=Aquarana catesbeiana TaxID=8400 RepID=UPI003CC960C8
MKSYVWLFLLLLSLPGSPAKKIQVGKFTFLVESVLKLKDFLEEEEKDPIVATSEACRDPRLPEEFIPVCEEADAPDIFMKLIEALNNFDECEICANPACPGCR